MTRILELKCLHVLIKIFVVDHDEDTLHLALVQYCFDDKEHSVIPRPHANSKQSESFVRTMPSTLQKLKDVSTNLTAKFAVCKSLDDDLFTASSAGAMPRNRQQVADMRRRQVEKETSCSFGKKKDPLFSVMLMCKESEGGKPQDAFVRMVTGAPEPMTVLAFNWSLNDIERFCTKQHQCTTLTVDPTFNLGDFFVTVTTYRHLLLKNMNGNHPVMMGPIFVHQQRKFETYHFFASSLVGLKPSLQNLIAFGTDGEKALSSAFSAVFNKAVHLRCFLHFKGNLESRLREYNIPKHFQVEFLRDIFGDPTNAQDGLVDAKSDEDFEGIMVNLHSVWDERERIYNNPPQFFAWFVKNCKSNVKETMLKQQRVKAGLGNPPEPFYTNDVESQNRVIKHQMNYKAQELPEFISSMKEVVLTQRKEIEKAAANIGEYRLTSEYRNLATDSRKFFQMTEKQREKLTSALFSTLLKGGYVMSDENDSSVSVPVATHTSVPVTVHGNNLLHKLPIPAYLADKIWNESLQILSSDGSICQSPGCSDDSQWLVKSTDLKRKSPFFVECCRSGQITCEQACGVFKCSKLCAHTVSVALNIDNLNAYIDWLQKQKGYSVNYSKLGSVDMPKGSGKKSSSNRKASQKQSMKQIKQFLHDNIGEHTYRIEPTYEGTSTTMEQLQVLDDNEEHSHPLIVHNFSDTPPPLHPASYVGPTFNSASSDQYTFPSTPGGSSTPKTFSGSPPLLSSYSGSPALLPSLQSASVTNLSMPYSPFVYAPFSIGTTPSQKVPQQMPFWIVFIKGNISRCAGCGLRNLKNTDGSPLQPPSDICLQHKEYVLFENPHTGYHQMSRDLRNVYYHAFRRCLAVKFPNFDALSDIKIGSDIKNKLISCHYSHLKHEFGINF